MVEFVVQEVQGVCKSLKGIKADIGIGQVLINCSIYEEQHKEYHVSIILNALQKREHDLKFLQGEGSYDVCECKVQVLVDERYIDLQAVISAWHDDQAVHAEAMPYLANIDSSGQRHDFICGCVS